MAGANGFHSDAGNVRVTITLNEHIYEEIKGISSTMGLRPSTWISMICTTQANNLHLKVRRTNED